MRAPDRRVGPPADPQRRPVPLRRRRRLAREETAERAHAVVRALPALPNRNSDRLEVGWMLAPDADAEDHPAAGDVVERPELAGDERGRAQRKEQHAGAEPDRARDGGE